MQSKASRHPATSILLGAALICVLVQVAAAQRADSPKPGEDKQAGFSFTAPKGWEELPADSVAVPGKVRKVWSPDRQATLVIFVQEPGKAMTARELTDASAAAMEANGITVREKEVRDIGGMRAMWLWLEGDGTGGALFPGGATKTTQVWAAIPREKDIIVLLMTCAEKDYEKHRKSFETSLKSLKLGGAQTPEQKASK